MNTKQKISKIQKLLLLSALILLLAGGLFVSSNMADSPFSGEKGFEITIVSDRDSFAETTSYSSDVEYLGDFVRTLDYAIWEDSTYGIYIKGFYNILEDMDNQYWWCVMVDGESAVTGADEIILEEGKEYSFVLMQGW